MSIEKITSKITAEAEAQREAVLAEARGQADAALAAAKSQAQALLAAEEAKGLTEKEKRIERRRSVADIDCRKRLLETKQALIGQCFDSAVEKLTAMDEKDYLDLLVSMGQASGLKGGRLVFNEKEAASIGPKVAAALNSQVPGGAFQVAEETAALKGGYLLLAGDMTINNTVEALVEESKNQLSGDVAAMLFGTDVAGEGAGSR